MVKAVKKLALFISAMRPKQWVKNSFVFAGLIFSRSFLQAEPILKTFYAFVLFSLASGSVYIINDIIDREKDALHPSKRNRPIASGKLGVPEALVFSIIMFAVSLAASVLLSIKLLIILLVYFVLVLSYSLVLKNVVILDVIIIALGFVLRTVGGSVAIDVWVSPWLMLCTTMLSVFLALNKRKNELLVLSNDAANHRKNLDKYTPGLIDGMISVISSTTLMSYSLYTFSAAKSSYMMLTIPFVLYGIFRYQYLSSARDMGGSPELVLWQDMPLLINILLWIASCIIILTLS
ncbi:MAG: decaprenyl-phosphate phosphoribosyltransferase [Bacillota bacterium]